MLNALEPEMHITDVAERKEPWYEVKTSYLAILLIVCGLVLMTFGGNGVGRTAGEAVFIAGVLTLTVDPYLKKRFQREAAQDIFHYLLGHGLPLDIKTHLRDIVLKTIYYRRDMVILCEPRMDSDSVTLDLDLSWEIVNPGRQEIKYNQALQFEESENPVGIAASLVSKKETYTTIPVFVPMSTEPQVVEWNGEIVDIEPEERGILYRFSARYTVNLPKRFFHVINFGTPTIGLTVRLRNVPAALEIDVTPAPTQTKTEWVYDRLFMQTDHVQIRWRPSLVANE